MFEVLKLSRWFVLATLLVAIRPVCLIAQEDPGEVPLGDVARNLRKNNPLKRQVIDDDNLPEVMQESDRADAARSSLRFLMKGDSRAFQLASPDVTCSLAFTANVKALLSANQYAQMDLPPTEIAKLKAQAVIEGDALTVPIFNGTDWHVSELEIALTVVKSGQTNSSLYPAGKDASAGLDSLTTGRAADRNGFDEVRPEKRPDITVVYRMRAVAPPWAKAVFSAPLNLDLAPGEEWHWAILEARGYPPQVPDKVSQASPVGSDPKSLPDSTPSSPAPDLVLPVKSADSQPETSKFK